MPGTAETGDCSGECWVFARNMGEFKGEAKKPKKERPVSKVSFKDWGSAQTFLREGTASQWKYFTNNGPL